MNDVAQWSASIPKEKKNTFLEENLPAEEHVFMQ